MKPLYRPATAQEQALGIGWVHNYTGARVALPGHKGPLPARCDISEQGEAQATDPATPLSDQKRAL